MTTRPASLARPPRVSGPLAARLLPEIGSWLADPDPARVAAATSTWGSTSTAGAARLVHAHGLANVLAAAPGLVAPLPDELADLIASSAAANRLRIARMQAELVAILGAFAAAGIEVMPMKGAILAARPGLEPARRPMADLDLLVRRADREAARACLTRLGYGQRMDRSRRPTHDTFELPGNQVVTSFLREDADSPRRVELHVEVKRHLWGWADDDDLTALLWADASRATLLGEPATVPSDAALLAHQAIHATSDLLMERGRLIQWLDLAEIVDAAPPAPNRLGDVPHPELVLPALRLAQRRLPGRLDALDLGGLRERVPEPLARWADAVTLDQRAGLTIGRWMPESVESLGARWSRWAPRPWRLAVAHPGAPLPVALARHFGRVVTMARAPQRTPAEHGIADGT